MPESLPLILRIFCLFSFNRFYCSLSETESYRKCLVRQLLITERSLCMRIRVLNKDTKKPGRNLPGFQVQTDNLVVGESALGVAQLVGFDENLAQGFTFVRITGVGEAEPTGTVETGDVATLEEDVTIVGVVGVTAVGADGAGGCILTAQVSGDTGVSTAIGLAVAFDHTEVGGIAQVRSKASVAVGQSGSAASGGDDGAGAGEDSVIAQVVITTENFEKLPTVIGLDRSTSADAGGDGGQLAVGIDGVGLQGGTDLFQVAGAVDAAGFFSGLLQSGQKHTGKDCNNSDNHQHCVFILHYQFLRLYYRHCLLDLKQEIMF